jgi:hypothetical protein
MAQPVDNLSLQITAYLFSHSTRRASTAGAVFWIVKWRKRQRIAFVFYNLIDTSA